METQKYFTMQKLYNLQKNPLKETKILQDKYHLKAKEELWKLKNISPCKNYIIFKKYPLNRNQNPSR
jgi:hypothetical protein